MEKVGCCLQEAVDREASLTSRVELLVQQAETKRFFVFSFVCYVKYVVRDRRTFFSTIKSILTATVCIEKLRR